MEREHVERNTYMWDGGREIKVRSRHKPRGDETDGAKQAKRKLEYCNDLQRMINDQTEHKKAIKADIIQSEREVSNFIEINTLHNNIKCEWVLTRRYHYRKSTVVGATSYA